MVAQQVGNIQHLVVEGELVTVETLERAEFGREHEREDELDPGLSEGEMMMVRVA